MDTSSKWSWVDMSDPQFADAWSQIVNGTDDLVVMGSGGVGKSVLLRMAADLLPGNTVVLSSTGMSAANLCGDGIVASTIHSFFKLKPLTIFGRTPNCKMNLLDVMCAVNTVLIDEVSMVNSSLLDHVLRSFAKYRAFCERKVPRIIMFGDILQLLPVVNMENETVSSYFEKEYLGKYLFFDSVMFQQLHPRVIHLDRIYRQDDTSFQNVLNRIRMGRQTREDLDIVNSRVCDERQFIRDHEYMMYLTTTNKAADGINGFYCDGGRDDLTFDCKISGEFDVQDAPQLPCSMTIGTGMQVMCLRNNASAGYQNGTLGRVLHVSPTCVVIRKKDGTTCNVVHETWEQYEYGYDPDSGLVTHKCKGTFTQMGCKPALACTIHKSQGLTLDSMYVDFNGFVTDGSVYMALSRCKSLDGIGLRSPIKPWQIKTSVDGLAYLTKTRG